MFLLVMRDITHTFVNTRYFSFTSSCMEKEKKTRNVKKKINKCTRKVSPIF